MATLSRVPLSESEINAALPALPGWAFTGDRLVKKYQCKSFRDALAFILRLGFEAEEMDHHPEISNVYNRVSLTLNTHDAGGRVTALDVELARRIEKLAPVAGS